MIVFCFVLFWDTYVSRDFLFREESRMASEILKSSEDGPSKGRAGLDVKRVLILATKFAQA